MTAAKSITLLSVVVAFLGNLCSPTVAFQIAPSSIIKKHAVSRNHGPAAARDAQRHASIAASSTTQLLSSPDDDPSNSREREMMDQIAMEKSFRQVQREAEPMPPADVNAMNVDPLIASLTRIDEPTASNVPNRKVPLFGEVPADDNLAVLAPVIGIGVLGFLYSIVVAFNSRDAIGKEFSKVAVPKMEYTPTKVVEGQCRGLCSSQEEDLDGLRNFMESLRK